MEDFGNLLDSTIWTWYVNSIWSGKRYINITERYVTVILWNDITIWQSYIMKAERKSRLEWEFLYATNSNFTSQDNISSLSQLHNVFHVKTQLSHVTWVQWLSWQPTDLSRAGPVETTFCTVAPSCSGYASLCWVMLCITQLMLVSSQHGWGSH